MSSNTTFQDWKPMILTNKSKSDKNNDKHANVKISEKELRDRKIENGDNVSKKISSTLKTAFQQKRTQLKLTQKQLAQQTNLDVKIISEIENGKREFNNSEICVCERVLGKLPRK